MAGWYGPRPTELPVFWDKIGYYSAYIRDIPEMLAYNKGFSGSGY